MLSLVIPKKIKKKEMSNNENEEIRSRTKVNVEKRTFVYFESYNNFCSVLVSSYRVHNKMSYFNFA